MRIRYLKQGVIQYAEKLIHERMLLKNEYVAVIVLPRLYECSDRVKDLIDRLRELNIPHEYVIRNRIIRVPDANLTIRFVNNNIDMIRGCRMDEIAITHRCEVTDELISRCKGNIYRLYD